MGEKAEESGKFCIFCSRVPLILVIKELEGWKDSHLRKSTQKLLEGDATSGQAYAVMATTIMSYVDILKKRSCS